ncbi:MAG: LytTR family DNA-binding domain-containing protein [bacterium]|nr:LytTR family DNA-binding domain-containing protein [bacterium]
MEIAIVEDEAVHSALLQRHILSWARSRGRVCRVFCYENAESFLFELEDRMPDAVFADIQMPGMNGMEMIRKLRERDEELPVVFTSGLSDYLQEGYEVRALHYLLKPISREKVFECMDRVSRRKEAGALFVVRTPEGMGRLNLREVNYCESQGHYARFLMRDGTEIQVMKSLSELEAELSGGAFVRCHRCYLCNLENVRQILQDSVLFDNDASIPVSRRLYRELNRRFIDFYRR